MAAPSLTAQLKKKVQAWTFVSLGMIAPSFAAPKAVTFKTADGITLQALYVPAKENQPTVVMHHGVAAVKEEWKPLIDFLETKGIGSFSYDARGHGKSSRTHDSDGGANEFQTFRPGPGSQWEHMIGDVGAALQYLQNEQHVKRSSIQLAGASIGANVMLNFAALAQIRSGVILLSPGLNYQGIETESILPKAKCPVLIVVSPQDRYAYESSQHLKNVRPNIDMWSDVKPGHGVQMFDNNLLTRLADWISHRR